MDDATYLDKKNKSKYSILSYNLENINLSIKKIYNSDNLITNKSFENSTITKEQIDIDINININENISLKEGN